MTTRLSCLALTALAVTLPALARTIPTSAAPAVPGESATQAPIAPIHPKVDGTKVLVLPFTEVTSAAKRQWIGRAMHQSMLAELARLGFVEPISPKSDQQTTALDADTAARAGKDAGSAFVVLGSYQIIKEDLHVAGQIIDVATGKAAGEFKASGSVRDLFGVEDIVANQVKKELATAIQHVEVQPDVASAPLPGQDPGNATVAPTTPGYEGSELQNSMRQQSPLSQALHDSYNQYRYGDNVQNYPTNNTNQTYGGSMYGYQSSDSIVPIPTPPAGLGAGTPYVPDSSIANAAPTGSVSADPRTGKPDALGGTNYNKSPYRNYNISPFPNFNEPLYRNYNESPYSNYNGTASGGLGNRSLGGNSIKPPSGNSVRPSGGNSIGGSRGNAVRGSGNSNSR